ncbi:hemolysin C [Brachyspira pilosicoli]|uniref:HlyC/CorC family transporter n=1 Tax=Brachyspira pilosicoli TaxID=52584 RepID=A0A5C8EM02_BRAPL|nr:hemolysin C [Brachyspira pilosicoli]TXJ37150.1 HlyC/CorC family transporter [Brachyspira pilosicoli]
MPIKKILKKIVKKNKDNYNDKSHYINLSLLTEEEREIVINTVELKNKNVKDIMIPRVDVNILHIDTSYEKVIKAFNRDRNSRIPIYKDGIDDIVGVLYVKDLVDIDEKTFNLKKIIHKAFFVPISISLMELLKNFRTKQIHIAMVVDEYGGFSGIVTMEDVLEEIVGDIRDEFDEDDDEEVKSNDDGSFLVDARMRIEEINKYGILPDIPDDDADTVGGFLFSYLGRLPKRNEAIKYNGYSFTVVGKSGNIVTKIRIEKLNKNREEAEEENKEDEEIIENDDI